MDPKTAREIGRRLGMTKKAGPPTAGARPAGEWGEGITAETLKQDPTFTGAVRKTPFAGSSWGDWARGVPQRERAYQWTGAGSHAPIPASAYDPTNLRHFRGYEGDPTGDAGRIGAQQAWTPAMKNYPQYKAPTGGAVTAPGGMSQEAGGTPAVVTPKTPGAQDAASVAATQAEGKPAAPAAPVAAKPAPAAPQAAAGKPSWAAEAEAAGWTAPASKAAPAWASEAEAAGWKPPAAGGAAGGKGNMYTLSPEQQDAMTRDQFSKYLGMSGPGELEGWQSSMNQGLGRALKSRRTRRWLQNVLNA